jgi:hypothetical protein
MTESIRNDPERFRSIFNNISSMIDYSSHTGQDYMYGQQQQYPSPDYGTEANAAILVDEAEKLYNNLVKDCTNKVITDCTFSKSSLPLLPPSSEQQSHTRSSPTAANQTHTYGEERTFIQSEIDNGNQIE